MGFTKKIIFLTYIPSPYRVDFFNELNKSCDLTVLFYYSQMPNAPWQSSEKKIAFKHSFLFENKNFIVAIFNLFKFLFKNRTETIIIGGYAMAAEMLSILFLTLFRIDFVINSDGGFVTNGFFKTLLKKRLIQSAKYWLSSGVNTTQTLMYYGAKKTNIFEYNFSSLYRDEIIDQVLTSNEIYSLREELDLELDTINLIFVGQLVHRKGADILLKSLEFVNPSVNLKVLIIGDGELKESLVQLVKDENLSDKVTFLGKLPKYLVLKYLKASDCFVFPSREDIWGLVLNEAVANGLPIISTNNVGSSYSLIQKGDNGFIIDVDDSLSLSNAINEFFSKDLNSMRQKSLEIAKKFTIEQMVSNHLVLFKKIDTTKE